MFNKKNVQEFDQQFDEKFSDGSSYAMSYDSDLDSEEEEGLEHDYAWKSVDNATGIYDYNNKNFYENFKSYTGQNFLSNPSQNQDQKPKRLFCNQTLVPRWAEDLNNVRAEVQKAKQLKNYEKGFKKLNPQRNLDFGVVMGVQPDNTPYNIRDETDRWQTPEESRASRLHGSSSGNQAKVDLENILGRRLDFD